MIEVVLISKATIERARSGEIPPELLPVLSCCCHYHHLFHQRGVIGAEIVGDPAEVEQFHAELTEYGVKTLREHVHEGGKGKTIIIKMPLCIKKSSLKE